MKIGIINSVYKKGSTGRLSYELARFFISKGIECKVFYGRGKKEKDGIGIKFAFPLSVFFHALFSRIFDSVGRLSYFSTKRLIKRIDRCKIDTLFFNNLHGYYININEILSYAKKRNIKTFFVLHDCWLFTGHCAHFLAAKCAKWKEMCFKCPCKHEYPKTLFFDNSKRNYLFKQKVMSDLECTLIGPSKWICNMARQSFLKDKNIINIPNGIDVSTFTRSPVAKKEFALPPDKKIILCVANIWDKKKGLFDVVRLANIVNDDYILILVGKTKTKIKHDKIIQIPQTNSIHDLVKLYSIADVMFNPTYEDNYPTVNLESISCKCPVVSYDVGGACEILKSKHFIKPGDVENAYKIIKDIVDGKELYLFAEKNEISKDLMFENYYKLLIDEIHL